MKLKKNIAVECLFVLLILSGCLDEKYRNEPALYSISMSFQLPATYTDGDFSALEVRLTRLDNGVMVQREAPDGLLLFEALPPGTYRLWAGKTIDAETALAWGSKLVTAVDVAKKRLVTLSCAVGEITISDDAAPLNVQLNESLPGDLIIKELFYSGTTTPNGKPYWSDQFVELYNNSDQPVFVDSLCIANVDGSNNGTSSGIPSAFRNVQDSVYLEFVWMIPGNGTSHRLLPGESLIIAQDAMNHRNDPLGNPNSFDLSFANWEVFLYRVDNQKDIDIAEAPNLIEIFANRYNIHDWIFHSKGVGIALFRIEDVRDIAYVTEPYQTQGRQLMRIPARWVEDAVETLANRYSEAFRRFPTALDAGFVYCDEPYNGQSCRRKPEQVVDGRTILMDTNNSSADFEVIDFPTPGILPTE